jgi:hypothetical protein
VLVDEARERVHVGSADHFGCRQARATWKDCETCESAAAALVEEADAPVDRLAKRLLSRGEVARAGGENAEPSIETFEQRLGRQRPDARRRQLDRERQPVDASTDLPNLRLVLGPELEPRIEMMRALGERARSQPSSSSGETGKTCSPETWRTARLVTSTVRRAARATSSA